MKSNKTTLSLAIGSAFAVSMVAAPAAHAANNPFAMQQLQNGYMVAAADTAATPAKAGDGKCGGKVADEMKAKEGKCGGEKKGAKPAKAAPAKAGDGKCGGKVADEMKAKEGKCGGEKKVEKKVEMKATDKKMPEGKCGEGKCGGKKKADDKAAAPAAK